MKIHDYIKWSISQKKAHNLSCEFCYSKKQKSSQLVCHHIIPIKKSGVTDHLLTDPHNILVLCHSCHSLIHGNHTMTEHTKGFINLSGGSLKKIYDSNLREKIPEIFRRYPHNPIANRT